MSFALVLFTIVSCSTDSDLLGDYILEEGGLILEEGVPNPEPGPEPDPEPDSEPDPSLPCQFDLNEMASAGTVVIDCILDLDGDSLNLSPNVDVTFEGGQVINGTLNFTGGTIDGRLLNHTLQTTGEVSLKDPSFKFDPEKWTIVQGGTDDDTAFANRLEIIRLMHMVKKMGGNTLALDEFDAYFNVTVNTHPTNPNFYYTKESIRIPSDFNLAMSDRTHLRVQPNGFKRYALVSVREANNVNISGGTLHGDREEHDYTQLDDRGKLTSHEWGQAMAIHGSKNVTLTGVTMKDGSGDGLSVSSLGFTFNDDYIGAENITVRDCTFDSARRNNLSITDVTNMLVENSTFLRSGIDKPNSKGTNPRFQIDIEPEREYNEDTGEYIHRQIVDGLTVRNNVERESGRGGFLIAQGQNIIIEGNDMQAAITNRYGINTTIRNNTSRYTPGYNNSAITAGNASTRFASNNKVYGNTIIGYVHGMNVAGENNEIYDNEFIDCKNGIFISSSASDSSIHHNTITSDEPSSTGMFFHTSTVDNVEFSENQIDVVKNPLIITATNNSGSALLESSFRFVGNEFYSRTNALIKLDRAHGVEFTDNQMNVGIQLANTSNMTFNQNTIMTNGSPGIDLTQDNSAIEIKDNGITVNSQDECIKIGTGTNPNEVSSNNNICN